METKTAIPTATSATNHFVIVMKFLLKILVGIAKFTLRVFCRYCAASKKEEMHKPSMFEVMCGERIPTSDRYFIPDKKLD
jgi:hypothetical protein